MVMCFLLSVVLPSIHKIFSLFLCVQTLHYLQQNAKERAELAANAATSSSTNFSIPSSTSKMSLQELEELRKQLGSVTASSSAQQVQSLSFPSSGHKIFPSGSQTVLNHGAVPCKTGLFLFQSVKVTFFEVILR